MKSPSTPYRDLERRCERIDARSPRYRFDLEADVCWARIAEPGVHFPDALLAKFGLETEILGARPDLHAELQWGFALSMAESFARFEEAILWFVEHHGAALGKTRSIDLLCEEEIKHIALFRRYVAHLRAQRPECVPAFDAAFVDWAPFPGGLPPEQSTPENHFLFWIYVIFVEELTVYIHDELARAPAEVQPTWLSIHAAHRREEIQHLVTDATFVEALDLSEEARRSCARSFAFRIVRDFPDLASFGTPLRMLASRHTNLPELRSSAPSTSTGFFRDVAHSRSFHRTREHSRFESLGVYWARDPVSG
jgi:hypothetical protein